MYGSFYIKRLRQGKLQRQKTVPSHHSDIQAASNRTSSPLVISNKVVSSDKDAKNTKLFKTKVVCEYSEPVTKVIDPMQITKKVNSSGCRRFEMVITDYG